MHPTTHAALPARLQAALCPTLPLYATPRGRRGGRTYAQRGPSTTTLYRHRKGHWVAVRTY